MERLCILVLSKDFLEVLDLSCKSSSNVGGTINVPGKQAEVKELVKAFSLEEANTLLASGHVFLSVYWNTAKACEEYVFGKLGLEDKPERRMGFLRD